MVFGGHILYIYILYIYIYCPLSSVFETWALSSSSSDRSPNSRMTNRILRERSRRHSAFLMSYAPKSEHQSPGPEIPVTSEVFEASASSAAKKKSPASAGRFFNPLPPEQRREDPATRRPGDAKTGGPKPGSGRRTYGWGSHMVDLFWMVLEGDTGN